MNSIVQLIFIRKVILKSILFFFATTSLPGQTNFSKQIAKGVYFYFGDEVQRKPANCVWIIFKDYVLVIDANYPWGAKEIITEIKKTTDRPIRFVFNTHYHHDHSFGNCVFADSRATIISTEETAREMKTVGQKEWDQRSGYSGGNMEGYKREFPSLVFENKMVFDDGEQRVELIKMGPAHTGGDGVAWLPKEKILITGDLFVNGNPWGNNVGDPDVNYEGWFKVLDTLAGWDPLIVVPGHGNPGNTENLTEQRLYLSDMYEQVHKGIKAGKSKEELVKEIDLSKHPVYGSNKTSIERSIRQMYNILHK
ncbi:MAG: hypothetical protein C5B52_13860 [Bacteroidetes bacterium]|nr:MAG: hypothetical protein C5B52_13860 [Bacteroidota bacterium]